MGERTIGEAIEYAAENLSEGHRVVISIERHGYGVTLERDVSHSIPEVIDISEESMIDDIIFATDIKKEEPSEN